MSKVLSPFAGNAVVPEKFWSTDISLKSKSIYLFLLFTGGSTSENEINDYLDLKPSEFKEALDTLKENKMIVYSGNIWSALGDK